MMQNYNNSSSNITKQLPSINLCLNRVINPIKRGVNNKTSNCSNNNNYNYNNNFKTLLIPLNMNKIYLPMQEEESKEEPLNLTKVPHLITLKILL